ncbi:hypothetical protein [Aquimarina sp. MMG016]|nr:hypothetical protein [Aquimarina sp. MMG016]MBQ4819472.1 hypothetical protein [Aquimarina sp. MMG016]
MKNLKTFTGEKAKNGRNTIKNTLEIVSTINNNVFSDIPERLPRAYSMNL